MAHFKKGVQGWHARASSVRTAVPSSMACKTTRKIFGRRRPVLTRLSVPLYYHGQEPLIGRGMLEERVRIAEFYGSIAVHCLNANELRLSLDFLPHDTVHSVERKSALSLCDVWVAHRKHTLRRRLDSVRDMVVGLASHCTTRSDLLSLCRSPCAK